MKLKKILMFGGAFDPFHNGHLAMLKLVLKSLAIDHVIIIPNYMCPNKRKPFLKSKDRLLMLKKVVQEELKPTYNHIHFECSNYEIRQKKIGYTYDTMTHFRKQYSKHQFYLLIGSDNFFSFHLWKKFQYIRKYVALCVVRRGRDSVEDYQSYIKEYLSNSADKPIFVVGKKPIELSSSEIRNNIKNKASIDDYVPKIIAKTIEKKIKL